MAFAYGARTRVAPFVLLTAGMTLYPKRSALAESHELPVPTRKPIYDSPADTRVDPQDVHDTTLIADSPVPSRPTKPTPSTRLAGQIKETRLFLHKYAVKAEDGVNNALTKGLKLEKDFTSTVASLAPPRGSGERILPGAVYVLVAAMAGSIITRNRNILLRATVPIATGVTASYYTLPITTRNVGNLIWSYEERYPVIRDNHLYAKERIFKFVETGKAHTQMGLAMAQDKVNEAQESLEGWVRKGK